MMILILGGTGAMGSPLTEILSLNNEIWVSSRSDRTSSNTSIHYIKGNAMQRDFLENLCNRKWDAIIDFMNRTASQLKDMLPILLSSTKQYVFISSARVYAECYGLINENTPRLLDVSSDIEYLKTNEYALEKAREEDLIRKSGYSNFTIIRPSITYNDNRLQLGVMEKEDFIYRALHNRAIVFSHDLEGKITTMTSGFDVARGIASIIGKDDAFGETFHITSPYSLSWGTVLDIYRSVLEEYLGHPIRIQWTDKTTNFAQKFKKYQIIYCRYFNRSFDNTKICKYIDVNTFITPEEGLKKCLRNFLSNPKFSQINWSLEGINNRVTHEHISMNEIQRTTDWIWYVLNRYNLQGLIRLVNIMNKLTK